MSKRREELIASEDRLRVMAERSRAAVKRAAAAYDPAKVEEETRKLAEKARKAIARDVAKRQEIEMSNDKQQAVKDQIVQTLKDHALENYSHKKLRYDYFIETFDAKEWEALCERHGWQVAKIKADMKSMARMWAEQESNCW